MNKPLPASLLSLLTVCIAVLLLNSSALATYYKYVDGSGSVVITNKKESVPAKYRAGMKVIKEENLEKNDPGAKKPMEQSVQQEEAAPTHETAAAAPAEEPQSGFAQICSQHPWVRPLIYLVAFLAALVAVMKAASLLSSPHLSKALYLTFFLGVAVFIYKSYVDHVAQSYTEIKSNTMQMMQKSNRQDFIHDPIRDVPDIDPRQQQQK